MEKILAALFLFFVANGTFGQDRRSEFEITRSALGKERKTFVAEHINLNQNEEMAFWPIYEDYEIDRAKFSGKKWDVFKKYASGFHTLTAAEAKDYLNDFLRYEKKEIKLRSKYSRLMSTKLSSPVALRFVQIEEYMDSRIRYTILGELPFIQH